jgi:hypothetical protein
VVQFPLNYLGLPLSIRKLNKFDFFPLIDKITNRLPGWKAALIHQAGRTTLIQVVLIAILIYHRIALQCPKWVIKATDNIMWGFLWKGRKDVKGRHCLVGWQRICRPRELGGLGIHNLEMLGWSLHMRWLWLKKTLPNRLWAGLDIQISPLRSCVAAMFDVSCVVVGNGNVADTLFWDDRWLEGEISIAYLAANLFSLVPKCIIKRRKVRDALVNNQWVNDIWGPTSQQAFSEFFMCWDVLQGIQLVPEILDQHIWFPSALGSCSKSAYESFFVGSIRFEPAARIWKT